MRVRECFEVKTKGIMKAEVDLSPNYMYYLRNGLIEVVETIYFRDRKIRLCPCFSHFQRNSMTF